MIKKIIAGILILAIVVLAGFKLFYKGDDVSKKLETLGENLTSYHTEATMDIVTKDEVRSFYVTVDYKNQNENDLFRISLLDKNINQEQIMLRNKDGVYVLTPKLNQVYQFKGDYPLNSPKPYLYHSLIEGIKNNENNVEKLNDGYLVSYACDYENSPNWKKQDVKLSTDLKPVWVNIYDDNNNVLVEINFSKVNLESSYTEDYFDVNKNMETSRKEVISSTTSVTLPYLVSENVSSTLKEQTEATVNGETIYILTYEGSKEFTVIVKDYVRGDTNGDGLVTMKDVTRLVNYLNDDSIEVINKALDVNGDGLVTIKDVTRLTEYLEDNSVEIF